MGKADEKNRLQKSEDFAGFMNEFQQESDRAAAVLGATYLETRLEVLLRSYFIEDEGAANDLFGVGRPLGSFDARRQLAYALNLIGKEEPEQLKLIQEFRNRFAHHLHDLKFTDEQIAGKCRELAQPYEAMPIQWGNGDLREPRWAFTIATVKLMMRLNNIIDSIEEGMLPGPRTASEFEQ